MILVFIKMCIYSITKALIEYLKSKLEAASPNGANIQIFIEA